MLKSRKTSRSGFTLIELLVSMALGLVVIGIATALFKGGMSVSFLVGQRAEMQQNARGAVHAIIHDLSLAGTGVPSGGVQLPAGTGSVVPRFDCNQAGNCNLANNSFPNNRLSAIIPNPGGGPTVIGAVTSAVSTAHTDSALALNQYPLVSITPAGTAITVDSRTTPILNNPGIGLQVGDLILLTNSNGSAIGEVTTFDTSGNIFFADSDTLKINQSGAAYGNIKSLASAGPPVTYPSTTATRIFFITYFIEHGAGPDGVLGTADDTNRLMRQVNGLSPTPVADNIENLQLTYDIFDDAGGIAIANTPDANLKYNQIRKVNVAVTARSASKASPTAVDYQRLTLATAVSPRNLSYHDRYQ